MAIIAQILGALNLNTQTVSPSGMHLSNTLYPQIVLKEFIDTDLDVLGWFAPGHHNIEAFLANVAKQEPNCKLYKNQVEHVWARIDNNHLELLDEAESGSVPITLIRIFEKL